MTTTKATNVYTALLQAQRDMGPLLKNSTNPHFKSKYADLTTVIETILKPLHDNGLVFLQRLETIDGVLHLSTDIVYGETGETLTSTAPIVCKDPHNPQAIGAAITYMRRFSLMAITGLAPEDDDGAAASKPPTPKPAQREPMPILPESGDELPFDDRVFSAMGAKGRVQKDAFRVLLAEVVAEEDVKKARSLIAGLPTYDEAERTMSYLFEKHGLHTPEMTKALKERGDSPHHDTVDVVTGELFEGQSNE